MILIHLRLSDKYYDKSSQVYHDSIKTILWLLAFRKTNLLILLTLLLGLKVTKFYL